jgi:hypothetical protein
MKKIILGALLLLSTMGFSQTLDYKDNILSFSSENSQGVEFINKFNVDSDVIDRVNTTEAFCKWERTMETENTKDNSTSKLQFLKNKFKKGTNNVLIYIWQTVEAQNMMSKYKCKNSQSFKIIDNSKGSIYINNDKNELVISEHYSAQNGYGNDIPSTLYIIVKLDTGDIKTLL